MSITKDFVERLYAGWYGKIIGVRYGVPTEGWDYETIRKIHGELNGYLVDYADFAADDDSNGPMFFLRTLEDYGLDATAEQMGYSWLNYVVEQKGFFWWGGYGNSTEHTSYLNLKSGIRAPRSGSILQNSAAVAEQIGGQIFIDTWGLVTPGNPDLASSYAQRAASVSHDGNGIYGGVFVATAISYAFIEHDIRKVIEKALTYVPDDSEYMRMAKDVIAFYDKNPADWHAGFAFIQDNYGYDRYPGVCHIIPNSAVMLLSMLYGGGEFDRTINICNMCGWDTDCNIGNVGCIMGVLVGLDGIDYQKWRKPIHDFFVTSSSLGSLNHMDMPWCVHYISNLAYKIAKEEPPKEWKSLVDGTAPKFHFDLPGSTHAFRIRFNEARNQEWNLRQTAERAYEGQGSLEFFVQKVIQGDDIYLYHKTFYTHEDFHDSRYEPFFSPTVYPGETVSCAVSIPQDMMNKIKICLFAKDYNNDKLLLGEEVILADSDWKKLSFTIPKGTGMLISEVGLKLTPVTNEEWQTTAHLYVDSFDISGNADYGINFCKEKKDRWHWHRTELGQTTTVKGIWNLDGGCLSGRCYDYAEAYTGRYDFADYSFTATMIPQFGNTHQLNFRVGGVIRSYALALLADKKLSLRKNTYGGYQELVLIDYNWNNGGAYTFRIALNGPNIQIFDDEKKLIDFTDVNDPYLKGQVGCSIQDGSHCLYRDFYVRVM